MFKIPLTTWIANAAAVLRGHRGSIPAQAQTAGCSRQTVYDHASKVQRALVADRDRPQADHWRERAADLQRENSQLWGWLGQTLELPEARQRQWVVTAAAIGLSLDQIGTLLAILVGAAACPGRSTLHRIIRDAGRAAEAALKRLDAACQS